MSILRRRRCDGCFVLGVSWMLTHANSCRVFCTLPLVALTFQHTSGCVVCFPANRLLHAQLELSPARLSRLTSSISVPSPAHSRSELIVAPPPPWPFSCGGSSAPQQPSTSVVAAFITPKQPNDLQKPANESMISTLKTDKPPLAQPEPDPDFDDIVFESFNQRHESGGLFLEDDDSKRETIKRCPPG